MLRILKSETDHSAALAELEKLIDQAPERGTAGADRLELLAVLIEDFEARTFPGEMPDPVTAIEFRMEQRNLAARDLIPYIGSRSKVSEVLARKRPLTLSMIRALHSGLSIPAKVLLQEADTDPLQNDEVEWELFPFREMVSRGWVKPGEVRSVLQSFFEPLKSVNQALALYRKNDHIRSVRRMDSHALLAWTAQILVRATTSEAVEHPFAGVTFDFMQAVARLSWSDQGPVLAAEFLAKHGIPVIIEPHLSHTHLDGAAIFSDGKRPVIGLTLRYDRLDNFWFVLMHELAHIALHFPGGTDQFYDDLDVDGDDVKEKEADEYAGEALIPQSIWVKSAASRLRSPEAAEHLAKKLGIHPAIVAGRMRHQFKAFRLFNNLVGHHQVRRLFPEVKWSE